MPDNFSAATHLEWPCDYCHAGAGEPCEEGCPGAEEAPAFWELDPVLGEQLNGTPPSSEESWGKLMAALHRLPFGALAGECPERVHYDTDEFLAKLATYVTNYERVSRLMINDLQAQARKAIGLQFEKDSARAWLGVPCTSV